MIKITHRETRDMNAPKIRCQNEKKEMQLVTMAIARVIVHLLFIIVYINVPISKMFTKWAVISSQLAHNNRSGIEWIRWKAEKRKAVVYCDSFFV